MPVHVKAGRNRYPVYIKRSRTSRATQTLLIPRRRKTGVGGEAREVPAWQLINKCQRYPQSRSSALFPSRTANENHLRCNQISAHILLILSEPISYPETIDHGIEQQFFESQSQSLLLPFSLMSGSWCGMSTSVTRTMPPSTSACPSTMVSMPMMGFATSFWFALLARTLGGPCNGNIGVIQAMIGESTKRPECERR